MGKENWIATRDDSVVAIFDNRRKAVSWMKKLIKQSLKDLDKQDKTDEFDYLIQIPKYRIEEIKHRETYLGL